MQRRQLVLGSVIACWAMTGQAAELGIAAFNLAWAGTSADFAEHIRVCTDPAVSWCDTRAKIAPGSSGPTTAEAARAKQCQTNFDIVAGGQTKGLLVAPCNAYKLTAAKWKTATPAIYAEKLGGLRKTLDGLIRDRRVDVIAFQEVRSEELIKEILGSHALDFDSCVAAHSSFQTVGFAWRRAAASERGMCKPEPGLAIKEIPGDLSSLRYLRPGISLSLQIGKSSITLMNLHLKSGCANLMTGGGFKGHELTDADGACQILNRQVAPLESWVENVSHVSPLFVLLGDFNRRLDEEAAAAVPANQVRTDGTDPATPHKMGSNGEVTSRLLWQELSDGNPTLEQIPLEASAGCTGFKGLDHILISGALKIRQPTTLSSVKVKIEQKAKQIIPTSDHCPRVTVLSL